MANKKINKQIEKYQRELIDTHYQEVENMYKKMRGWRHDYRNHIQTMKVLAEKGDLEAIKEYLNKLEWKYNNVYEINGICQKIMWRYLNHEEVKLFINILENRDFLYKYYVTYENFTEEICNKYKEKYPDINFDIVKSGREKALRYCNQNRIYSNCGYIEPPNLSEE